MHSRLLVPYALLLALALAAPALAQPEVDARQSAADASEAAASGVLTVAVYEAPPFAERTAGGTWDGLGVALAEDVGQLLGRPVRFAAVADAEAAVAAAAGGGADLALAPATAAHEATADFTAPFFSAPLGAARPATGRLAEIAQNFFSPLFFQIVAGLAVLLLVVGAAIWAIERGENSDDFDESARGGIWDGFWWAGVTMTTIGYGDKAPKTVPGQTLALFWMLVSMAVTATLTASLVSALGMGSSSSGSGSGGTVSIPGDFQDERVGVVAESAAAGVLREAGVDARPFPTVEAGLRAVDADSVDTFVDTAPRLRAVRLGGSPLQVQTTGVEFERWAFAVAPGSPLREAVGRAVLDRVHSADWPSTVRRHLGSD